MAYLNVETEVDTDDLARDIAWSMSVDEIVSFVEDITDHYGDLHLDRAIVEKLTERIAEEESA